MRYFELPNVSLSLLDPDIVEWIRVTGDTITEPAWTIRPYKLNDEEVRLIQPLLNALPFPPPAYVAIIMVPAGTVCKTHVDDIGGRITAINLGVQIDNANSFFEYMDGDEVIERLTTDPPKVWAVNVPHRVDNTRYERNRVVLSLSYTQTVDELHELIQD